MKTKSHSKSGVNIGRWLSYAAAGAATAFAASNDAEAGILYSGPINLSLTPGVGVGLGPANVHPFHTLAAGTHTLFDIANVSNHSNHVGADWMKVVAGSASRGFKAVQSISLYIQNLPINAQLVGGGFIQTNGFAYIAPGGGGAYFGSAGTGFIGFRFKTGGNLEYGWARVTMGGGPSNHITLDDYAYTTGTTPTSFKTGAVPEPASLGLLAVGAVGLLAFRAAKKREEQSATAV